MMHPIVALDIGSTKVACVIAMPTEGPSGYDVLGSGLCPYPPSSSGDGAGGWPYDTLLIGRTIEQALEATGVSGEFIQAHVALSHPALQCETVLSAVPLADEPIPIRKAHVERLTRAALAQALGIDRDALAVERLGCSGNGFEGVRDPWGLTATRLRGTFHIVSLPVAVQRAVAQAVEFSGLEVARLSYSLIADAYAVASAHGATRFLLIDVGGFSTDVGLFEGGHLLASQTMPWGGQTLATAIAKALQVTPEQATALTLQGLGSRRPEVKRCLEQPLGDLERVIHRLLEGEAQPAHAWVTGRGALIDGFAEWVERITRITTSISRSRRLSEMTDLSRQVGLSTAMGLVELVRQSLPAPASRPSRLVDHLLSRTRSLLAEYF